MKAGSVGFHCGLNAYDAGANMTPHWRRAMTCAYMPDGATFKASKDILPPEFVAKLKVGDFLNDEHQNPLVWAGM